MNRPGLRRMISAYDAGALDALTLATDLLRDVATGPQIPAADMRDNVRAIYAELKAELDVIKNKEQP